jgi:hypothetical protein
MIRLRRSINAVGLTAVPGGAVFRKLGRRKLNRLGTGDVGASMARMTVRGGTRSVPTGIAN